MMEMTQYRCDESPFYSRMRGNYDEFRYFLALSLTTGEVLVIVEESTGGPFNFKEKKSLQRLPEFLSTNPNALERLERRLFSA